MGKRIRIVSTKEVVQPAESTNQGEDISSEARDEASDPSIGKSLLQGSKKRARGPTKKKEIWDLASDEQILVTFNELCQPIGDEGNELTNFLGTLVRMPQHIGIHYPEWRKVPKEKKEDLWSIIKEKFSFESDQSEDDIKGWILMDMSSKWKSWKYELKKSSYDPSKTIDEIVESQTDDRVEASQFRKLVTSWFTEEKQVESARKKVNRLKSIEPHVTGTKSFARVKEEETKKNKGVSPSRGDMYCITRTRKNGSIVNPVAAKVVADIKARSTDKETINSSDWENDDLSKVKGPERRGSFRCTGKFLVKKNKTLHDPQVPLLKAQVKFLRQGFMMFAAAVQEQVPNLNMSSFMNYMNMEVDDLSSNHDNTMGKNPSSASASGTTSASGTASASASGIASGTTASASASGIASGTTASASGIASGTASGTTHHQKSQFSVHDNNLNKSNAPLQNSVLKKSAVTGKKSAVRDTLNKSGTSRFNNSGAASSGAASAFGTACGSGTASKTTHHHKSAVRDTLNKSSTSRFNTSVSIGKKAVILKCLEAL